MTSKRLLLTISCFLLTALPGFAQVAVMPVPWDPTNFSSPHTAITGVVSILQSTVNLNGSTHSFAYSWNFGDGTANSASVNITTSGTGATVGNVYNLSTTHTYTAPAGTLYTAVITVTDKTASATYTGNYPIIVQSSSLTATVNRAIDNGLWYLHTSMDRANTTNANSVVVPWGGWDGQLGNGCLAGGYACLDSGGLDATNVQAYEVSGHTETGPSMDPYTDDVARGLARVMYFMQPVANYPYGTKSIGYNPALMAARCSDGTQPNYTAKTCTTGTYINYNPGATTCTTAPSTPCTFTYDGNNNHQIIIEANDGVGDPGYQTGMLVTAIVAGNNPSGVARTGTKGSGALAGVLGQSYQNIVQDLVDGIGYCQYYGDIENAYGYDNGGGWEYYCASTSTSYAPDYYDDNSPSQWNAIALIAASRGFGIAIPQIILDTNQVWATWSQCVGSLCTASGYKPGQYGYDEWNNPIWGPYAVTPSGLVQLAMDGVGRTASGAADQRWNLGESFYHDNFCNSVSLGAAGAPLAYTYGLFSFTKAMELHSPGGVLTPIQLLEDRPSGTNPIDWYGWISGVSGATCNGVAQTLVSRQNASGYWYGEDYNGYQYYFETAWSINMLTKSNFVSGLNCPAALSGAGKAGGRSSTPLITLTWNAYSGASNYSVFRGPASTGPFSLVTPSTGQPDPTTSVAFNDQTAGLVNGGTYWYEIQPNNALGAICTTANPISVTIP